MTRIVAITGGVGGAKLALGLSHLLDPTALAFAANTGDDFEHLGFSISPDLDTLTYTLAGLANSEVGWGRAGETWQFMTALEKLGGDTWFRLGDLDLALHVRRRELLAQGQRLTDVTHNIATALGVRHAIYPMTDAAVRTQVHTADGPLSFQHYFVRDRCAPAVTGFHFAGVEHAHISKELDAALRACDGVIICPSNPFVSVDPVLAVPGVRAAIAAGNTRVVAVSPIVSGLAIKGPAAKMMRELGVPNSASAVAEHYGDLLDGFVLDADDADLAADISVPTLATPSVMRSLEDRIQLGRAVLDFLASL